MGDAFSGPFILSWIRTMDFYWYRRLGIVYQRVSSRLFIFRGDNVFPPHEETDYSHLDWPISELSGPYWYIAIESLRFSGAFISICAIFFVATKWSK